MNSYITTVIKTGNSYALRVPKKYVEDAQLHLGQKATITLPLPTTRQDSAKIQKILKQLRKTNVFEYIQDPIVWQQELRKDRPLPDRN